MQIFELTQKKLVKEYDPNRPPPKKNFGSGVGPGVQPQYTATPRMKGTPQPGAAPRLPPPTGSAVATTGANTATDIPYIDAPAQLTGPAPQPQIGTTYDPNVIDVYAREKTATAPQAQLPAPPAQPQLPAPAAAPTPAPAPAPAPAPQPDPAPAPQPDPAPAPPATTTGPKVGLTPPQTKTPGAMDTIAQAMMKYNAGKVGLGFLITEPKIKPDRFGKITIDDQPFNVNNPEHIKAIQNFTKQSNGRAVIGRDGYMYVDGQRFNPELPLHMTLVNNYNLGAQQRNQKRQKKQQASQGYTPMSPQNAEWQQIEAALLGLGHKKKDARNMAYRVPANVTVQDAVAQLTRNPNAYNAVPESLSWSRGFDPSRTLLEKIKKS